MMLGTNIEQDEMTCCVQECQLWRDLYVCMCVCVCVCVCGGGGGGMGGGALFFSLKKSSLCLCFFPFGIFDGRCKVIVSIPDHCLHFCFCMISFALDNQVWFKIKLIYLSPVITQNLDVC